jgi:hypothetical protein
MTLANDTMTDARSSPAPVHREGLAGLSGLQISEARLDGRLPLPPFGVTTAIRPEEDSAGRLLDAKGKLIAHGSETCLIMSAGGKEQSPCA